MIVKDLRKALNDYPDDMEVLTKKTELLGNVAYVNSVREDSYGFFGTDVPCVLLTDEFEPQESEDETSYTPEEVRNILIEEGQEHGSAYGLKLGDIIKFSPTEVEQILKAESEGKYEDSN